MFALFVDGIGEWGDGIRTWDYEIAIAKSCLRGTMLIALTPDNHVIAGLLPSHDLEDITHIAHKTLDSTDTIRDIFSDNFTMVVTTEHRIGIIDLMATVEDVRAESMIPNLHIFPSGINLVCFSFGHGLVRTEDNHLYSFGDINRYDHRGWVDRAASYLQPHAFSETASITEMFSGMCFSLLLLADGRVYACGYAHTPLLNPGTPFSPVMFPEDTIVIKIKVSGTTITYITATGLVYYADIGEGQHADRCLQPALVRALDGYFVEDVFLLRTANIIQYDGGRLCMLHMQAVTRDENTWVAIDPEHMSGTRRPTSLPFFDDKGIVAVTGTDTGTFFITNEGRAYKALISIDTVTPEIGENILFNTQPLAVPSCTAGIRSAQSLVECKD